MSAVSLIDADGSFVADDEQDPLRLQLCRRAPVRVIAVLGPQGSGKSTLGNALCGTDAFPVAARGALGRATTRGVDVAVMAKTAESQPSSSSFSSSSSLTASASSVARLPSYPELVLDVEGADARDRGRAGRSFQARAAAFAASVADAILINLWYHDTGRVDSAGYGLLRAVLSTSARRIVNSAAVSDTSSPADDQAAYPHFRNRAASDYDVGLNPGQRAAQRRLPKPEQIEPASQGRTALAFVIRDVDDDVTKDQIEDMLRDDTVEIWEAVSLEAGLPPGDPCFDDVFDISVFLLPHMRHYADRFAGAVDDLRTALRHRLLRPQHSKSIPADGFVTYAASTWDSLNYVKADLTAGVVGLGAGNAAVDVAPDDFYAGEDLVIVAAYRCDEVFSELLAEASGTIGDLHDVVDQGGKVDNLGEQCERLIADTLEQYEADAAEFADEPVFDRKRRELEAIIDTGLHSIFLRQLQVLREEAIKSFKRSVEGDLPEDYALFLADAEFVSEAKRCQRPSSNWSFSCERADLQNMLREIAAQHRKLVNTQVTASEQQSQAIRILQMQNTQLRAVQQQALGGAVGQWNIGAAYRPPDSNVNISLGFNQGRTSVQVSMVPDESSTLLGSSDFTAGILPGNLGLSFNLNM